MLHTRLEAQVHLKRNQIQSQWEELWEPQRTVGTNDKGMEIKNHTHTHPIERSSNTLGRQKVDKGEEDKHESNLEENSGAQEKTGQHSCCVIILEPLLL